MNRSGDKSSSRFLRKAVIDVALFSFAVNILLLASPLYILQVYDRVLSAHSLDTLVYLTVAALLALSVIGVLEVVRGQYANRIAARLDAELGTDAFLASLQSPGASFGDVQPLRDLATLRSFAGSRTVLFLFDLPFAPLFLAMLYFIHPLLFLFTSAGALVLVAIAVTNQVATAYSGAAAASSLQSATNLAQTLVRNFGTLKPLGMITNATEAWGRTFAAFLRASDQVTSTNAFYSGLSRTLRMVLQIGILGTGAYLVLEGRMTAGIIFAASLIAARALQPIDQVIGAWRQIVDSYLAWKRLRDDLSIGRRIAHQIELPSPRGDLLVEELTYEAPTGSNERQSILRRINFRLRAGESLAIIGPSGAGKTTLAQLLVGALNPTSGSVRLDGADLRDWRSDALGPYLGYLPQEVELFPATVAQNIARLSPASEDAQVIKAALWADVHNLILKLKDGYGTQVGPGGLQLSGGERQRVGLARAFYGEPRFLVLDEPNASLDAEGEYALDRAITGAKERMATLVVVTHKISIAAKLDFILFLRNGAMELFGPSTEVLRRLQPRDQSPLHPSQRHPGPSTNTGVPPGMSGRSDVPTP